MYSEQLCVRAPKCVFSNDHSTGWMMAFCSYTTNLDHFFMFSVILIMLKLEYSSRTTIPWLLMPWFLGSPGHQQPNIDSAGSKVLVSQEEGFRLTMSYECWEMTETRYIFMFLINWVQQRLTTKVRLCIYLSISETIIGSGNGLLPVHYLNQCWIIVN